MKSATASRSNPGTKAKGWDRAAMSFSEPLQWGVMFILPLAAAGYWLYSHLSILPAEAWNWTLYPGALVTAVILVPLNWWLEALKWAELLPWATMSRRIREVLYGTAWSMIGPLRLGAGVGRLAAVRPKERNIALRAFGTASVAQWWCTITAAAIALFFSQYFMAGIATVMVSGVTLGLYLGWSPSFWHTLKKMPFFGHWGWSRKIATVRRRRALTLSIARFFVMLFQFILVLNAFGHLNSYPHNVERFFLQGQGVALTWGLTSLAPLPAFGDLGLREAAAIAVIPAPTPQDMTAIVAATLTLWIINLFLPAMTGLVWHALAKRKKAARQANLGA